jgi:hypothetical protein
MNQNDWLQCEIMRDIIEGCIKDGNIEKFSGLLLPLK